MANEFARNAQDASLNPAAFALPTTIALSKATLSAAVDLGANTLQPANIEVQLSVPALSDTIAPAASTAGVTYEIVASASSTLSPVTRTIGSKNYVGTGTGVVATVLRARVPSDCERYIGARIWMGTTCTDASALSGTLTLRF